MRKFFITLMMISAWTVYSAPTSPVPPIATSAVTVSNTTKKLVYPPVAVFASSNGLALVSDLINATNGLAKTSDLVKATNGLVKTSDLISATNGLVKTSELVSATNGLAKTSDLVKATNGLVKTSELVSATNGLVKTSELVSATNGLVKTSDLISATNGLAKTSDLVKATNGLVKTSDLISATNGLVKTSDLISATNGLAKTSDLVKATNGLASTSYVNSLYAASHILYVDNQRTDSFTSDGTIMRPFRTVSAAMSAIGDETSVNDWRNSNSERYYTVKVMPGVYPENVVIPWRPYLTIELSSALIAGNLVRTNAFNMIPDGGGDPRCTTVVIKGDSLRSGYADGNHSYVGVSGKVTFQLVEGSDMPPFNELHVIQAGIRGGVTYQGQASLQSTSTIHLAHIFLRDAMVGPIVATNDWTAYLFAYGWGGGHQGGGPAGSGIGPLIGSVCPYNLQSTMISGGLNLKPVSTSTLLRARWHNVLFETGFAYNTTNTNYSIDLDTASYNSWIGASTSAERAKWKTGVGGYMYLTDIDILPTTTYPLPSGALWNSNGVPLIVP